MRTHTTAAARRPRLPRTRARLRAARHAAWRGLTRTARAAATYWYSVAALTLISAAAFQVDRALGLLVAGVAVLVFEWRVRDADAEPPRGPERR